MEVNNKEKAEDVYRLLFRQIEELLSNNDPLVTSFSNIAAAIKQSFKKISWSGFYFMKGEYLHLGPFQGKVACTRIRVGEGVCGTAAETKLTQVVQNVHEFPGHIACDVDSNSEIVVPLFNKDIVYGVLDIDSTEFSAFDEIDKIWLENICKLISDKLNLTKNIIN